MTTDSASFCLLETLGVIAKVLWKSLIYSVARRREGGATSLGLFVFHESMSSSFFIAPYHYRSGTLSCACVGFTWVNAAQVSVINCHRAGSRGAVINFERVMEWSFPPVPGLFREKTDSSRARQFTAKFHCRRMPPPANGPPRSNIGPPNSLWNTFLMNYCSRKWK